MSTPSPFADQPAYEAYRSPEYSGSAVDAAGPGQRPAWLTAICVISIILGVLGVLGTLMGIGGLAFNRAFGEQMVNQPAGPGIPPEMAEAQNKFQRATLEITAHYFYADVILLPLGGLAAIGLIVGGTKGMTLLSQNRQLLRGVLIAAVAILVLGVIKMIIMNMEMYGVMNQFAQDMANSMPANAAQGKDFMVAFMQFFMIAGLVLGFGWQALLLLFYVTSIQYLGRPNIVALYSGPPKAY